MAEFHHSPEYLLMLKKLGLAAGDGEFMRKYIAKMFSEQSARLERELKSFVAMGYALDELTVVWENDHLDVRPSKMVTDSPASP